MPHRILNFDSFLGDVLLFISLQIVGFEVDNTLKLQLSGLAGSMLAVRTIDGKVGISDWLRVAVSGMVLANFIGFFWCDFRGINIQSHRAFFCFFIIGFFSDILLRGVKTFGNSFVAHVPELTKAAFQKVKVWLLK